MRWGSLSIITVTFVNVYGHLHGVVFDKDGLDWICWYLGPGWHKHEDFSSHTSTYSLVQPYTTLLIVMETKLNLLRSITTMNSFM